MSDENGTTATGGLHGITEDTPGHAGSPRGAGSIDGISSAGASSDTAENSRITGGTQITLETAEANEDQEPQTPTPQPNALSWEEQDEQREKGMGGSEDGGVTGEHEF